MENKQTSAQSGKANALPTNAVTTTSNGNVQQTNVKVLQTHEAVQVEVVQKPHLGDVFAKIDSLVRSKENFEIFAKRVQTVQNFKEKSISKSLTIVIMDSKNQDDFIEVTSNEIAQKCIDLTILDGEGYLKKLGDKILLSA